MTIALSSPAAHRRGSRESLLQARAMRLNAVVTSLVAYGSSNRHECHPACLPPRNVVLSTCWCFIGAALIGVPLVADALSQPVRREADPVPAARLHVGLVSGDHPEFRRPAAGQPRAGGRSRWPAACCSACRPASALSRYRFRGCPARSPRCCWRRSPFPAIALGLAIYVFLVLIEQHTGLAFIGFLRAGAGARPDHHALGGAAVPRQPGQPRPRRRGSRRQPRRRTAAW